MPIQAGTRFGAYEIAALIGAGAMGEVYRAIDTRLHRTVAIKILSGDFDGDADRLRRFMQEAEATGRVSHPNIVAVYDVGTQDGAPFIVSELLEGETLRPRLGRGRIPVEQAIRWTADLAGGLAAAHERGLVHRDLKPENVFVTTDGRVKILDFGLARLEPSRSAGSPQDMATVQATQAGAILGTPGYMAPEQLQGRPADGRADVFALGAVFYEMLTGSRAFSGATMIDAMHATLHAEPAPLSSGVRAAAPGVERLLARAMAKDPAARVPSARDFATELAGLAGAAPAGRSPSRAGFLAAGVVLALATAAVVFLLVRRNSGLPSGAPEIHSLAVLPLENLSHDASQEFFSDGMTAALITDFAKVSSLRVISRTSVMRYRNAAVSLPQIARELKVDAIVSGSVMRVGDEVRIDAQLIRGATDEHLWAKSYSRKVEDVLRLQSEIASAIVHEIRASLSPADAARLGAARPVKPAAHDAYLKGRYELDRGSRENLTRALALFNEAIASDPGFAPPYAGLADTYSALRSVYLPPHEVMPKARAAAHKAVEIDPDLAEGHVSLGTVETVYDFDWPAAEREFQRAIALKPGLAEAHDGYGVMLAAVGRLDEAIAQGLRAQELDPMSPLLAVNLSWSYYLARRYPESVAVAEQAVALEPGYWMAQTALGLGYEKVGRLDEAVAALQRARKLDSSPTVLEFLAGSYVAAGKKAEARAVMKELTDRAAHEYICPYEIATAHVALGDTRAALADLEKGFEHRADCMVWMETDPKLDAIRQLPEFEALRRKMNLPPR